MRPRKQMTLMELMIVMAIIGILAAIVIPGLKQAKDRARAARSAAAERPVEPDGQLNTIEVSEVSPTAEHQTAEAWSRIVAPLLPLGFVAIVAAIIVISLRRQMSGHAKQ